MSVRDLSGAVSVSFLLASSAASASPPAHTGLSLSLDRPPTQLSPSDSRRYRFPDGTGFVDLDVLNGVVAHVEPGAKLDVEGARSLGGRSWLVPADSPSDAIAKALSLDALDGVLAFPDVQLHHSRATNDPNREGQWYLDDLGMDALHAHSMGDPSVRVAVIDSGIDHQHADLVDRVVEPYDAFSNDDDPSPNPGEYCPSPSDAICDEHGTAVSGVSVATADNGVGIVGMCPSCSLIPIKLLGDGAGALSAETAAFEHAIQADAAVINNSWGFTTRITVPVTLEQVIERATVETRGGLGAVVVFAAGNDNREVGAEEMQAIDSVLCISATDSYGYPTSYTNFGDPIDVAAPSATVSITPLDELTIDFGGTSAAAPVIAGLAGWILSVDPSLTAEEVRALIIDTAVPSPYVTHDEDGHHDTYGYGLVSPMGVLEQMTAGNTVDSGTPPDDDFGSSEASSDDGDKGGCTTLGSNGSAVGLLGLLAVGLRRRTALD